MATSLPLIYGLVHLAGRETVPLMLVIYSVFFWTVWIAALAVTYWYEKRMHEMELRLLNALETKTATIMLQQGS
jgi:hypothetical protein